MTRQSDLQQFYSLIEHLCERNGGRADLAELQSYSWPSRGVYFFFDDREPRRDSGTGPRIVRVGTHALTSTSRSTLRQRLSQHRGKTSGGGNHRGSIFRLLVGQALLAHDPTLTCVSWGVKGDAGKASMALQMSHLVLSASEKPVEEAVSAYLSRLTFTWLPVDDDPGPGSLRGVIERNAIALLSNWERSPLDPPSRDWLGRMSNRPLVAGSGLWNQRHVTEEHDPSFVGVLSNIVEQA